MKLFPAIDLRDGKVVRLIRGNFDAETVYNDDPVDVARSFANAGAPWIHVVDLDGARTSEGKNRQIVQAIAQAVDVPVQTGGGVRDRAAVEELLAGGVARMVFGTVAIEDPDLVDEVATAYPKQIAVGLDARGGLVAGRGWTEGSSTSVIDLVKRFSDSGVAAFVVTDIDRDGMLGGADLSGLREVLGATEVDVVASGGVGTLRDLESLAALEVDGRRLEGAIVGKALYEGRFSVSEALDVLEG